MTRITGKETLPNAAFCTTNAIFLSDWTRASVSGSQHQVQALSPLVSWFAAGLSYHSAKFLKHWCLICKEVEIEDNLWPTVSRPVCPGVRRPSGTRDQFFFRHEISCRQLRLCYCVYIVMLVTSTSIIALPTFKDDEPFLICIYFTIM
jgi:hypothetical protein